jgi:hypothetical protein
MAGKLRTVGISPGLTRGKNGTKSGITQVQGGENQINKQETRWGSVFGQSKGMPNTTLNKYAGHKEGGKIMATKKLFGGKETFKEELNEAKAIKSGKISPMQYAKGEESEKKMKCGGKVKKMAGGGFVRSADGIATKGKTKGKIC